MNVIKKIETKKNQFLANILHFDISLFRFVWIFVCRHASCESYDAHYSLDYKVHKNVYFRRVETFTDSWEIMFFFFIFLNF